MIVFPNCKINLGLHILRKRSDGYHDLETVFYPIPLRDGLEIIHSDGKEEITFTTSGIAIETAAEENICVSAYRLLKTHYPELPHIQMHLHKAIPTGAGLGGGSADGAFALCALNKKFNLSLTEEQLISYALQLGSDCPFFIKNTPCYATGRGEELTTIDVDLSGYKLVLVKPDIHIPTKAAFQNINPDAGRLSLKEIINLPIEEWQSHLFNDFELPIFKQYPEIANIRNTLYEQGAIYASLSGSGSAVFGIFKKEVSPVLSFPSSYFIKLL